MTYSPAGAAPSAPGFAKGGADVQLEALGPSETLLKYQVKAQVGGKMAQLGARLIDSTAKTMADQFFERFAGALTPAAAPAEAVAETTPAAALAAAAPAAAPLAAAPTVAPVAAAAPPAMAAR